jgi:hypothetical protein
MGIVNNPALYQINTRVWLTELSRALRRSTTLDDIPDPELDRLAEWGFSWVWLLSVWQTGTEGQRVSRGNPEWRRGFQETLPDLADEDIVGSGFAIRSYQVDNALGGNAALGRLRDRLRARGLRLMFDFVVNHTALDHAWVDDHPEYYVHGTELDVIRAPQDYARIRRKGGELVLALGRDPYFPGWPDTLQLNFGNSSVHEAMIGELLRIADQCDGVRCDMAMLVLPEVFERTWGIRAEPFWPVAIAQVRGRVPDFRFMAEVYWDLEWTLQQQGFDYTYDKRLYDRLREHQARSVRDHFCAGLDFQGKLARFLENHDEPRAAATYPPGIHEAAAVVTFLAPGLRFFQQGQFEGRKKHISPHLRRAPIEPIDHSLSLFYDRLLVLLRQPVVHDGHWQLLRCLPAWEGNGSWDQFIASIWLDPRGEHVLVAVNYGDSQAQCYVELPFADLATACWRLRDQIGNASYERDGADLHARGLYLDEPPWKAYIFSMRRMDIS